MPLVSAPPTALRPVRAEARLEHEDLRSVVTVSRDHPQDVGDRQVYVRVDDAPVVKLRFGESMTMELLPGRHRVRVHNTLFRKDIPFTIEPGERLEFVTINYATWWTAGIAGVLGSAPLFLEVLRRSRV